ncbi:uncharacterized protein LOC134198127 [Corticium candelabrum]|uniref:uncharacterized protein LOC134198127 n=1 Tax=Corticium candelabrum TaxID=121492 RepID=UPI002E26F717|nr:uncharacterized protein LOC134198127 [Corticium candelabrum]
MSRVVEENRTKFYEGDVSRKLGGLRGEEHLIVRLDEVICTLENQKETLWLELSAFRFRSGESKFKINLSQSQWRHQVNQKDLRLYIVVQNNCQTLKIEKYNFRMCSRQQLASWAAELIQASTFHTENQLRRCFHVKIATEDQEIHSSTMHNPQIPISGLLQAFHPNTSKVVVRDPITLSLIQVYDMTTLTAMSLEYIPQPYILLSLRHVTATLPTSQVFLSFHSVRVAEEALKFLETFLSHHIPDVYSFVKRNVVEEKHQLRRGLTFLKRNVRVVLALSETDSEENKATNNCDVGSVSDAYEVPLELLGHETIKSADEGTLLPVLPDRTSASSCNDSYRPVAPPVRDIIRPGFVVPRNPPPVSSNDAPKTSIYEDVF